MSEVSGLSELGFYDSQTLLMVAAKSHQQAAAACKAGFWTPKSMQKNGLRTS